jgi:hypothetical protein
VPDVRTGRRARLRFKLPADPRSCAIVSRRAGVLAPQTPVVSRCASAYFRQATVDGQRRQTASASAGSSAK